MNPNIFSSENSLVITFLASFLIWFMLASLGFLGFVRKKLTREQLLFTFLVSFLAWLASEGIKWLFPTLRPFEINGGSPLTLTIPFDSAFPSSHAAVSFGLASSVFTYNRKLGIIYFVSGFLVGLGRVLGNVHFVIDILGGSLLGMVATATVMIFRYRKTSRVF